MKENFKKMVLTGMVAGSLVLPCAAGSALAADAPEADLSMGLYSQYIWRGFAFSKDSIVVQPSVTVGYKGFAFNLWGNLDTEQYGMESEAFNWNETDMTISYDGSAGVLGYSAGYIYYDLDGIEDTAEIYLGLSVDTLLSPSLTYYQDVDNVPGWYAVLDLSHSFALSETMSLDLGGHISYLDDTEDYNALHDAVISAALPVALTDNLTVSPELYVSFALSDDADDLLSAANMAAIDEEESTFVYGGVSASYSF